MGRHNHMPPSESWAASRPGRTFADARLTGIDSCPVIPMSSDGQPTSLARTARAPDYPSSPIRGHAVRVYFVKIDGTFFRPVWVSNSIYRIKIA